MFVKYLGHLNSYMMRVIWRKISTAENKPAFYRSTGAKYKIERIQDDRNNNSNENFCQKNINLTVFLINKEI